MIKVVKFGGSSLASAEQFAKVGKIIQADKERRYVVPSAPGKRNAKDTKVTDMLYACYALVEAEEDFRVPLMKIKDRYDTIINGLNLKLSLEEEFKKISENFKNKAGVDYAASRGEYLNGIIMANYLGYEFVDAAEVISFEEDGTFDAEKTNKVLAERLEKCERAVIPGFYGRTEDGRIYTFSRGGSDITGSLVAEAVKADLYENWTDVPGMLMADPKVVKNPLSVPVINYRELRELSLCGAEVLHEDAVAPVRRRGIPINIRSTSEPKKPGTLIVKNADFYQTVLDVSGISGKTGYCSVLIERERLTEDSAMKSRIDEIFRNHGLEISAEQIALDSVSLVVNASSFRDCEEQVIQELHELTGAEDIDVSTGLATIAVVGRNISKTVSVSLRIFEALANEHINLRFADHGAERISMQIGVNESDYKNAIRAIYKAFTNVSQLAEK